jgi:hypothetical protein
VALGAADDALAAVVEDDGSPAAGAGIAAARSVGVDDDLAGDRRYSCQ